MNVDLSSKSANICVIEPMTSYKRPICSGRNQKIPRDSIGLFLHVGIFDLIAIKEHHFFVLAEDVRCLMEESKPEVVVLFVSETHLDTRRIIDPVCGSAYA